MQNIAETFVTTLKQEVRKDNRSNYLVRTTSRKSNERIVNYFNNYPLFSSKYLDYTDWLKVYNLRDINNKKILNTSKNIKIIWDSKNNMNNQRTIYNWDHLNNFYILN